MSGATLHPPPGDAPRPRSQSRAPGALRPGLFSGLVGRGATRNSGSVSTLKRGGSAPRQTGRPARRGCDLRSHRGPAKPRLGAIGKGAPGRGARAQGRGRGSPRAPWRGFPSPASGRRARAALGGAGAAGPDSLAGDKRGLYREGSASMSLSSGLRPRPTLLPTEFARRALGRVWAVKTKDWAHSLQLTPSNSQVLLFKSFLDPFKKLSPTFLLSLSLCI